MSEQPLTAAELADDCHRLIQSIERKPASIKLLLGAREALQRFADYKTGRTTGDRLTRPP